MLCEENELFIEVGELCVVVRGRALPYVVVRGR